MELNSCRLYMENGVKNALFDGYGVYVKYKGEVEFLHSENFDMDTYVDVASMGKVLVTSTLILHAIGDGKIKLDDTLPKFFASVPDDKKDITVFDLLVHTSGIIRYQLPEGPVPMAKNEVIDFILSSQIGFQKGTEYRYSCNGYILLGYIVEKVYGMGLDEAFEKFIKEPLGLTRSMFNIPSCEKNVLKCYRWNEDNDWRVDDENAYQMGGIAGNGASFWTTRDMVTWIEAVLSRDERLYPREIYDEAEKNLTEGLSEGRGLGYLVVTPTYHQTGNLFPSGAFGHCGHCGHSFFIDRENDLYVILLTNATRALKRKNNFSRYDYDEVKKMREEVHNTIFEDLKTYSAGLN